MRSLITASLLVLVLTVYPAQAGMIGDIYNQFRAMFQTYEEAPYALVQSESGYQKRMYPARKWVCKKETEDPNVGDDLSKLFWPLFSYISGKNGKHQKIPMTAPVSTKYTVRSASEKIYEMCFYIGEDLQENPPQPNSTTGVYIQNRPEFRVLTRTVGGYMTNEGEWLQEAGNLAAVLEENGITVNLSDIYWIGYDSPMKFWFRRNEIWFPIEN